MNKIIIGFIAAGLILISGTYFLINLTKDESKVAEVVVENKENIEAKKAEPFSPLTETFSKSGSFIKIDPLHYASGQVSLEKIGENYKLKFANNFASADGPDLYVYLSEPQNFKNIALGGLDTGKTINLGLLKKLSGEQEYLISAKDFEKYNASVVIWCKQFGVQFSRADLR